MKLKEYAKVMSELAKKHPNADVVYSSDDEGNSFSKVHFHPGAGCYDGDSFYPEKQEDFKNENMTVNAVCIN